MPLSLVYYTSFERSLKNLDFEQKQIVQRIIQALLAYYASDCNLSIAQTLEPGFFYKQLFKPYYEAGIEGKLRVVMERRESECIAILAGNHDQIRRFLANQ